MVDPEVFAKYVCMTSTTLDYLADYRDAVYPMAYIIKETDGMNASSHLAIYDPADVDSEPNDAHDQRCGERQRLWNSSP